MTDFGIAKIFGVEDTTELTKTGLGVGTPGYMAPEQLLGAKLDKRIDIYNLGIVFYEYIAGRKPFRISDLSDMLLKDDKEMEEHLRRFLPTTVPEDVAAALLKALAKNPDDRFQDMGDFADLIEMFSRQEQLNDHTPDQGKPHAILHSFSNLPNWVKSGLLAGAILSLTVILVAWIGYNLIIRASQQTIADAPETIPAQTNAAPLVQETTRETKFTSTETKSLVPTNTPVPPEINKNVTSDIDGMKLIYIPAGEFTMGDGFGNADESPEHKVLLDGFWMDQTEVTNKQYAACVEAGNCPEALSVGSFARQDYFINPEYEDYPVIYINYEQAQAYCSWAERRLPTEAEWEKAARGTDGRIYPWGNTAPSPNLLNFNRNVGDTSVVGNYPSWGQSIRRFGYVRECI